MCKLETTILSPTTHQLREKEIRLTKMRRAVMMWLASGKTLKIYCLQNTGRLQSVCT